MDRISDKVIKNHLIASTTQAKLRNGRRVRHNMNSDRETDTAEVGRETSTLAAESAAVDSGETPPSTASVPIVHSVITLSPLDLPSDQFRSGLDRRKQNRQLLMEWLRTALVEGVDFGRVHIAGRDKCELARSGRARECTNAWHWSKPSLFKPGAEKISGMLGMTVHYPSLTGYETAFLSGREVTQIMMRCELQDAQGRVVAEGVGARTVAQDYGDINKALKMAEKSAHIDATLRLAGLSEVFTQDVEDRTVQDDDALPQASVQNPSPRPPSSPSPGTATNGAAPAAKAPAAGSSSVPEIAIIGPNDVEGIKERIGMIGLSEKRVLAWLYKVTKGTVTRLDQLNVVQSASLLKRLNAWAEEAADAKRATA